MDDGFRRRRIPSLAADVDARQIVADAHRGTYRDFLRRHQRESAAAAAGTRGDRERFAALLAGRVADTRKLRCDLDHLKSEGGRATGPNGRSLQDLDRYGRWELVRPLVSIRWSCEGAGGGRSPRPQMATPQDGPLTQVPASTTTQPAAQAQSITFRVIELPRHPRP